MTQNPSFASSGPQKIRIADMNPGSNSTKASQARDLLRERYRSTAVPELPTWNEVLTTLLSHRSVRAFLPKTLPDGTLETLVAAAQSAATSSNLQTWSVVAVEDAARKARLAEIAGGQAHIRQCPLFLVWLADLARLEVLGKARGLSLDALPYLETFLVSIIDASLAAQNAVTAAESIGLSTVYIGALRNDPAKVAAELGLPPRVMPVFGLCVGYSDPARQASIKPRLGQSVVLHRECYSLAAQAAAIEVYDEVVREFQREQNMDAMGWIELVLGRTRTIAAMRGRDRMREALETLGFDLR